MGSFSKKRVNETTPVYSPQLESAAGTVTDTFNQNQGNVQDVTDQITGLVPGLVNRFEQGDTGVNAARDYNVDVLEGRYLDSNPYQEALIQQNNDQVRNQAQVALGSRGLAGTSDYQDIIADRISQNDIGQRANFYNAERARQATAAGQAPGIANADYAAIAPLLGASGAALAPGQNAGNYAGSIGGLLGPYTNQTSKQSGGFLGDLLSAGLGGLGSFIGGRG
jgi:hypothetical protein